MNASVLILTLNEEQNLSRCLQSVSWSDDIVILDSFSSDRTVEIARAAGARVFQRRFDNERAHRTASLQFDFKNPWVFNPDADEITPAALRDEILRTVRDTSRPEVAWRVRFKTMFMGQWVKHSSLYPTWIVRLFQPPAVSFERSTNLRYVIHGPEGRLENHLLHYSFNKGLEAWFEKHNRYSSAEAFEVLTSLAGDQLDLAGLLSRDEVRRRRAVKELSFRLPFRPEMRFLYAYLLRRGFLDGRAGYHYCRLLSTYEYMTAMKLAELRHSQSHAFPAPEPVFRP
jgi:glycosyltransferase involved in cell wall biosynthesis